MPFQDDLPKDATTEKDAGLATTVGLGTADTADVVIGPYHLGRRLGEGGMGEVWLAEQKDPVRRRVALKLIKRGFATREAIVRFDSERKALALMDHPAIAKVFDAGTTPAGAPYFVMEYVAGIPITDYCDKHRLSTRERLDLLRQVCEGVQHAHQKAIIHRDLKPTNILVTEVDGRAAPKIIDFGVAKALTTQLSEETMFTRAGAMVGTPEYMSPEQASSERQDIDTRTDVYSLGIIFYELLVGAPPIELRKVAMAEFLRRLREDEPPKPSNKVSTHDPATMTDLARKRQSGPQELAKQLRGELDSIALKALEKERSRRYASASEFAADITRYLDNEPVLAVPPSLAYRTRKFARRNRGALITACAFALVLIAAAAISIRQSIRANKEAAIAQRQAAIAQGVNDFLQNDLLAQASAATQSGPSAKPDLHLEVRTALDRAAARIEGKFANQPQVQAAIRSTIGRTYYELGLFPEATRQLEKALDLQRRVSGPENPETLGIMNNLGNLYDDEGKYAEAEALDNQALEIQRRVFGPEDRNTLRSINNLSIIYRHEGKYAQAEALLSAALEIKRRVLGREHPNTLKTMGNLANVYHDEGKYPQAETFFSQMLEIQRRVSGPEHPDTLTSMDNLANIYEDEGKYIQAETLHSQTLEIKRRVLGPEHPSTLESMMNLALAYQDEGRYAQAEALNNQTLQIKRRVLGPEHPNTLETLSALAAMYQRQGKYTLAETYAAQTLAGRRHALGSEHPDTVASAADLALAEVSERRFAESESLAREAVDTNSKIQPGNWQRFRAESLLGASLAGEKKYTQAEPMLLEGYQGMLARKDSMAAPDQYHFELARGWLVTLYQDWGKPDKAAEWKKK